jgi:hypothetical protein
MAMLPSWWRGAPERHWADFASRMVNGWLIALPAAISVHTPFTRQIRENTELVGQNRVSY